MNFGFVEITALVRRTRSKRGSDLRVGLWIHRVTFHSGYNIRQLCRTGRHI